MFKRILKILLAFLVLLVISGVLLLNSVNTERNKTAIQDAILASTGYQLIIAGDMEVNFFPSIGLTLNDVRLKNPAAPQELASTSAAVLQIDVRAMIAGEILIEELSADDFHINYFVDAQGNSIWNVEQPYNDIYSHDSNGDFDAQDSENENIVTISFQRLKISNASIDIQDLSQGIRYNINNFNFEGNDTNLEGKPFDINVDFDFLNNGMSKPTSIILQSNITADINNGNISISDLSFNLTPLLLQGQIQISNFQDAMTFEGSLKSNNFNAMDLMQTLGIVEAEEEFVIPTANSQNQTLAFNFDFNGDNGQLVIPELTINMGNTELRADANVRFATEFVPTNISYNIISNSIDLSPFMSQAEDEATAENSNTEDETQIAGAANTTPISPQVDTELPIESLRSLNIIGSISIDSLIANSLLLTDINIFTNIENGVLDIEIQPITAYQGSIQGNVRLDARGDDAFLTTQLSLNQLNIVDLAPSISQLDSITGKLDAIVDYQASGSSTDEIINSLSGSTTFAITENTVDIGLLKQVFTAISALSPTGGAIEQWPDIIQFSELQGSLVLTEGIAGNQQLNIRMDNFDISGNGGIDLEDQSFNYDMSFTVLGEPVLQTIQVDPLYHNVSWPVQCSAAFSDSVGQYCRPDFTQVRDIFTQIGGNAVRSRINDAITDQVPDELKETTRGLLRGLLN